MIAVFHTNAGHMTLHDDSYNADRKIRTGNPYKELLGDLMKRGVKIELCGATAKAHGGMEDTIRRTIRAGKLVELRSPMKRNKLTRELQQQFLTALAETGIVSAAAEITGTSRTRVCELRRRDRTSPPAGRRPWRRHPASLDQRAVSVDAASRVQHLGSGALRNPVFLRSRSRHGHRMPADLPLGR